MTRSIRSRLFLVIVLGVVSSALSLSAILRVLSLAMVQRLDRARENVEEQVEMMRSAPLLPDGAVAPAPSITVIGMRGGYVERAASLAGVPEAWRAGVGSALEASASRGSRVTEEVDLGSTTLVVSASPVGAGRLAWAGYAVRAPPFLFFWQVIVGALAVATALLVAVALFTVATVKRDANALGDTLVALARDLSVEIPRPRVRELAEVADGIAILAKSLAESRKAEAHLLRALAERERLAGLGRVVAGVAHEVRNPLATVKLRIDLAAATGQLAEPTLSALSGASAEIERLDRLVADLLAVAGRPIGPRRSTAIERLLAERVHALEPWSAERGVTVRVSGSAAADVDHDSMTRAIDNVLRNAVEASPEGSVVDVLAASAPEGVRIAVRDRGLGVPAERESELFEPFFTTKSGGTGLGLAISRAIARAHGGDLVYTRVEGVTQFELMIGGGGATVGEARP